MAINIESFTVNSGKNSLIENEVNFYLIESEGEAVLVDSGFHNEETYKLLKAITNKWDVKAAIITHLHEDHAGGIPFLHEFGVKIFVHRNENIPPSFKVDIDSMVFRIKEDLRLFFRGFTVRIIHTPGHTAGHISPFIEEDKLLFSGDLILGRGTPWVGPPEGDMLAYMNTLRQLKQLEISRILPGHGPVIEDPAKKIEEYIEHRQERERQILEAIRSGRRGLEEITAYVYEKEELPPNVLPFARLTVLSHLEKLRREGRVIKLSGDRYSVANEG